MKLGYKPRHVLLQSPYEQQHINEPHSIGRIWKWRLAGAEQKEAGRGDAEKAMNGKEQKGKEVGNFEYVQELPSGSAGSTEDVEGGGMR